MPFALIPFMLLVVPIVAIATFIAIGGQIGIAATLIMILVTAVIGTFLLRFQGLSLLREIQTKMNSGEVPGRALGDGAMIVVAGILLLTPGFVTDAIGFLLFVPGVRGLIFNFFASRVQVVGPGMDPFAQQRRSEAGGPHENSGPTIDLDAEEFSSGSPDPNSPWNSGKKG